MTNVEEFDYVGSSICWEKDSQILNKPIIKLPKFKVKLTTNF